MPQSASGERRHPPLGTGGQDSAQTSPVISAQIHARSQLGWSGLLMGYTISSSQRPTNMTPLFVWRVIWNDRGSLSPSLWIMVFILSLSALYSRLLIR